MARIRMLEREETCPESGRMWDAITAEHGRMTNMKKTLAHSPRAMHAVMEWYALLDEVTPFLGERLTRLFMLAVSTQTDCLVCSTFYRRIMIEAGEDPDDLALNDEKERLIIEFGRQMVSDSNAVSDETYNGLAAHFSEKQMVDLIVFGSMMVVNNIFNNVAQVELDSYLQPYRTLAAKRDADA